MGDFEITFAISILDKRNDGPIVHASDYVLYVNNDVWARFLTQNEDDFLNGNFPAANSQNVEERSVVDLLNGNDGNWADLLNQNVDVTVRNIFRKLIRKNMNEDPDGLLPGDLSIWWKENNQKVRMPGGVASTSFGDLIEQLKHDGQNEMFVGSALVLK